MHNEKIKKCTKLTVFKQVNKLYELLNVTTAINVIYVNKIYTFLNFGCTKITITINKILLKGTMEEETLKLNFRNKSYLISEKITCDVLNIQHTLS